MAKAKSPVVTRENWKDVVLEAIRDLPEDLQVSIGHSFASDDVMVVTIAAEPMKSHQEACMCRVKIHSWNTVREQGRPPEYDGLYAPGGVEVAQTDWPVISVEGESSGYEQGFYVGRSPAVYLKGEVQVAILEEMHSGGGVSMINKDDKGRFVRKDGTRVLDWQ